MVATSRAPLKIGSETEFSLPPLELPAPHMTSLDALRNCPLVALFLQRAMRVKPDFALTNTNSAAIVAICRQLDGLPLALELAAARVRVLEPAALLQRLDHALDLLTSGDRDLPPRQRTLRATISWSYPLLDAGEQLLLRRLSSFHEGWTLEAMEDVCYRDDERHRALDELNSLVEKGLVRATGSAERYALLKLSAPSRRNNSTRVARWRAPGMRMRTTICNSRLEWRQASAQRSSSRLCAPPVTRTRTRTPPSNGSAACARAGDKAALEKGLLLCGHLNWFWHLGGQHFTARVLLDTLLSLAPEAPPSRGRALARIAAGMASTATGEWERSLSESAGGYEDGKAISAAAVAAEGLVGVGYCCLSLGRMDDAAAALDEAMARSAGGVCDFLQAISMTLKGMLLFVTGDLEGGMVLIEKARRIQERLSDREGGGLALSFLAQMSFAKGDHARALVVYGEALESLATIGDQPEVARVHCEMGWTALAAGDVPAAQRAFHLGVRANEEVGSPKGTGLALLGLAAVEAAEGRSERAVAIAAAAHALSERAGVVIAHPMDPGVVNRIDALKASIPKGRLDGLVANARVLSAAAVLAMVSPVVGGEHLVCLRRGSTSSSWRPVVQAVCSRHGVCDHESVTGVELRQPEPVETSRPLAMGGESCRGRTSIVPFRDSQFIDFNSGRLRCGSTSGARNLGTCCPALALGPAGQTSPQEGEFSPVRIRAWQTTSPRDNEVFVPLQGAAGRPCGSQKKTVYEERLATVRSPASQAAAPT